MAGPCARIRTSRWGRAPRVEDTGSHVSHTSNEPSSANNRRWCNRRVSPPRCLRDGEQRAGDEGATMDGGRNGPASACLARSDVSTASPVRIRVQEHTFS